MAEAVAVPGLFAETGEDKVSVATQWQLTWWRFRKHHLAMVGAVVVIAFYLIVIFADFLAYADPNSSQARRSLIPPQPIHLFDNGRLHPYVNPVTGKRDLKTFQLVYAPNLARKVPIQFFAHGFKYKLFGLIPTDVHLIGVSGVPAEDAIYLIGTDVQGRDIFSRLMFGTRTSLSIGLVGVTFSLLLGIALGGLSGYLGGVVDVVIQRIIEILRSIPT